MARKCENCDERLRASDSVCPHCGMPTSSTADMETTTRSRPRLAGRRHRRPNGPGHRTRRLTQLGEAEELLWEGTFSARGMLDLWGLGGLITIVLPIGGNAVGLATSAWLIVLAVIAATWLVLVGILLFRRWNVWYELTDRRFIHKVGLLRRSTWRMEVIDIDDISTEQKLWERIFDVGTIVISSTDRSDPVVVMPGIAHVDEISSLIDDARRDERMRRGIHVESI